MKKPTKTKLKKKIDKLFAEKVRRVGRCARCGKVYNLQCAHIYPRSRMSVRWSFENALCLCAGCHLFWAHKEPIEFTEFIKTYLGEQRYKTLRVEASGMMKWTLEDMQNFYNNLKRG